MILRLAIAASLAATLLAWGGGAWAASFDCKAAASPVEHRICADPDLNSYDSQMQEAYLGALDRSGHPDAVKAKQRAWLKQRDACPDAKCMIAAYQRQIAVLAGVSDPPAHCDGPTTIEIETCMAEYSHRAERRLDRYVAAVRRRLREEAQENPSREAPKAALREFEASQAAWVAYRKAECDAVYSWWSEGTIRGTMAQDCLQSLTDDRTRSVWLTWLHFGDSTPPLAPDPGKTHP